MRTQHFINIYTRDGKDYKVVIDGKKK